VHAHTAAMALSRTTIGTWIGVKALELGAWVRSTAATVASTAAVVGNRLAILAHFAIQRAALIGGWIASTAAVIANTAAIVAAKVAQVAVSVATKAWAAAQWLLNVALDANPIGLVVIAIAALVAGVIYAYKHSETFRNIVLAVWGAVKTAIAAFGNWFMTYLWPLIKRVIDFMIGYYKFLWNVIKAVWNGIWTAIKFYWGLVATIFNAIKNFILVTIPNAFNAGKNLVIAHFRAIGSFISTVWNGVKVVFNALKNFILVTIPNAFASGVNAIRAAWGKVQDAAKKPVTFVVNSVINPLIRGYNKIAGVFGAPKAAEITGFASGGRIPGAPSSTDNILAQMVGPTGRALGALKVATGEFIVNAKDTARALPLLQWINSGMRGGPALAAQFIGRRPAREPGDGSEGFAFAKGGLVGFLSNVWGALADPTKLIKGPIQSAINAIPGTGMFHDLITGLGKRLMNGLLKFVGGGGAGGNIGAAQSFVKAQAGKPYVWASAGPNGYDCSGIVSAVYNVLKGRNPYNHTFSTGSLPGSWFDTSRKIGPLVAGWSHPGQRPASASVGHMAGMIGGLPFESTGSRGVRVGGAARRVTDFANIGVAKANGGLVAARELALLDRGGRWPSGTVAANLSGHTEHVLTGGPNGDIADLKELLAALLEAVRNLGGDVADALERPTRRAVQLGRGRGATA
jgi:hypothetical protein